MACFFFRRLTSASFIDCTRRSGLSGAVWFGFGVCCLSLLSTIALIVLDRRTNSQLKLNQVLHLFVRALTARAMRFRFAFPCC